MSARRQKERPVTAYFDTAFVVKCYSPEAGSDVVRAFAAGVSQLSTSELTLAEFCSALHRAVRDKQLTATEAAGLRQQFRDDVADGVWTLIPCTMLILQAVDSAYEALSSRVFLRSADAIHLATARLSGHNAIYSNDRHLLAAADSFGLRGVNLLSA
jgi:predicted nucleic acid-binding protein